MSKKLVTPTEAGAFAVEFCQANGIDPELVKQVSIVIGVGQAPVVTVEKEVDGAAMGVEMLLSPAALELLKKHLLKEGGNGEVQQGREAV